MKKSKLNPTRPAARTAGSQQQVVSLGDAKPEGKYVARLLCKDCGHELNSTSEMTGTQLQANWGKLVIGSALAAGKCPNKCRSTFSDCNINTEMVITASEANDPSSATAVGEAAARKETSR